MQTLIFSSLIGILSLTVIPSVLAAEINFSADKLNISTDDTVEIRLSVDGKVDNGQVAIEGLENFTVLQRSSSQNIQIINGSQSIVQENILLLQPKSDGNIVLTAVALEDGEEVRSPSLSFTVTKSARQSTKEMLLQESHPDPQDKGQPSSADEMKKLLTTSQIEKSDSNDGNIANLQEEHLSKKLLTVQHQSAFNAVFWLEFLGIIVLTLCTILSVFWVFKVTSSKKKMI